MSEHHHGCGCHNHADVFSASHKNHKGKQKRDIKQLLHIIFSLTGALLFVAAAIIHFINDIWYLTLVLSLSAYILLGYRVIFSALKNIFKARVFNENFLMTLATICAFIIGEYIEGAAVMLFFCLGEFLIDSASGKTKRIIKALIDIRPDYANVENEQGKIIQVDPRQVSVGGIVVIKPGERIPLDGVIIKGRSSVDAKAITGESLPVVVEENSTVLSGTINLEAMIYVKVTKPFKDSTASKIIELAQSAAQKKTKTENFFSSFAKYYTPLVVTIAILTAVLPPLIINPTDVGLWASWVNKALILLVISCPCALVVSIPLSYLCSLGAASKIGVLAKGSISLQALANLHTIGFDKTGTLTKGEFEVMAINPSKGFTADEVISWAAKAETHSSHPIAAAIKKRAKIEQIEFDDYINVAGRGIDAKIEGKRVLLGNLRLMDENNVAVIEQGINQSAQVKTRVYVALEQEFIGSIDIADTLRNEASQTIAALKSLKVQKTVMITGDNQESAEFIAKQIGIDEYYFQALPETKVQTVESLIKHKPKNKSLAFVGDGINDAPVLSLADVSIAMGAIGSDAAIECADIVLMHDNLSALPKSIRLAKRTRTIVWQNIILSLSIKLSFMLLGVFGIATMLMAVFADVGVSLLATLNALRILKR